MDTMWEKEAKICPFQQSLARHQNCNVQYYAAMVLSLYQDEGATFSTDTGFPVVAQPHFRNRKGHKID